MKKPLAFLGVATGVAVAIAVALGLFNEKSTQREDFTERLAFPMLKESLPEIDSIDITQGDNRFTLNREGGRWLINSHEDIPAKTAKVNKLLIGLADLKLLEPKTDKPALYPRLGLGEEAKTLTLSSMGGTYTLHVGKSAPGGMYLRPEGEARAFIGGPMPEIASNIRDWADIQIPNIAKARVAKARITHPDGDSITIGRDTPGETVSLLNLKKGEAPRYDLVGDALAGAFNYLSFENIQAASKIDFADAVQTEFECFDGLKLSLRFKQVEGKWWMTLSASQGAPHDIEQIPDAPENPQAEVESFNALSNWALQIPDYKVTEMVKRRSEFLQQEETKDDMP